LSGEDGTTRSTRSSPSGSTRSTGSTGSAPSIGSLIQCLSIVVRSDSNESILREDVFVSIQTPSIVDTIGLVHSNSKDKNGSKDQDPSQESRNDHERSISSGLRSILVGSEVNQMDKEQPRNPGNDHQNEDGGVDPLKRGVVLVDLSSSDARAINEAVGSIK